MFKECFLYLKFANKSLSIFFEQTWKKKKIMSLIQLQEHPEMYFCYSKDNVVTEEILPSSWNLAFLSWLDHYRIYLTKTPFLSIKAALLLKSPKKLQAIRCTSMHFLLCITLLIILLLLIWLEIMWPPHAKPSVIYHENLQGHELSASTQTTCYYTPGFDTKVYCYLDISVSCWLCWILGLHVKLQEFLTSFC